MVGKCVLFFYDFLLALNFHLQCYRLQCFSCLPNSIASDCNFMLRIPSENRALSGEFPCDLTLVKENRCDRVLSSERNAMAIDIAHRMDVIE